MEQFASHALISTSATGGKSYSRVRKNFLFPIALDLTALAVFKRFPESSYLMKNRNSFVALDAAG